MKSLTKLCLLLCMMMLPFMAQIDASPKKALKTFKLREFEGRWVLSSYSIGGIGDNDGEGYSSAVLRIIDFNRHGKGKATNTHVLVYKPNGSFVINTGDDKEVITFDLLDTLNGTGKLIVQKSGGDDINVAYSFIALRDKKGKVNKVHLILTDTGGIPIVDIGTLERQQQL